MTNRIGPHQLRTLVMLASPTMIMPAPDAGARAMVRRGLLRLRPDGSSVCIAAAGLRALADAMEAGRVESALDAMRRDAGRADGD